MSDKIFIDEKRKANKIHACCECMCKIYKGETYSYISGVWDSNFITYKQCNDCHDLYIAAFRASEYFEEAPKFSELREFFMAYADFGSDGKVDVCLLASQFNIDIAALERLIKRNALN
jgi:hypothetical protein